MNKAQKIFESAKNNKKTATQLYNLASAEQNTPKEQRLKTLFDVEEGGNLCLKLAKQMDFLTGFDFKITDGKVVFGGELSEDKLAEAIDFLWRRGITNYTLPPNAPKRALEINEDISEQALQEQSQIPEFNPVGFQPYKKNGQTFEEACDSVRMWACGGQDKKTGEYKESNIGKVAGLSFFEYSGSDGDGKYQEFSIYDSEDPNNYENDGKLDKKGVRQEKGLQYRMRLYESKDHKLGGIKYYIPKKGKVPVEMADKIVALVKSQNALYVNFPKGLTDADSGVFRMACARAGMIPTGINIGKSHALKMEKEAIENILDKDALYRFKGNLGRRMLELSKDKPNDPRIELAIEYINQEKLFPVKKHLENCLTDKLQQRIDGKHLSGENNGQPLAHEVIGSAETLKQIFVTIILLYKICIHVNYFGICI